MNREELLKQLSHLPFACTPTFETSDMGIQYDYINSHGAGTTLGGMGYWPGLRIHKIESAKLKEILIHIQTKTLQLSNLSGTDLVALYQEAAEQHLHAAPPSPSVFFEMLSSIPHDYQDNIYCIWDAAPPYELPKFYCNYTDFCLAFEAQYAIELQPWSVYSDEDLAEWIERAADDLQTITLYEYASPT